MPAEKQQSFDNRELMDDIRYVNQANKVEIKRINDQIRLRVDEALYVVSCNLPPSSKTSRTEIKIVLPATHSPMDLGNSTDGRKLGIAVNQIRFGKPESGFAHLLRRLKLKE